MDTRNIVAAFIWAMVCAGTIHGQNETSPEAAIANSILPEVTEQQQNVSAVQQPADPQQNTTLLPNTTVYITDSTTTTTTTAAAAIADTSKTHTFMTEQVSTTTSLKSATTESCMVSRKDEFIACFESLGNNAVPYVASRNLTGFLDDICDGSRSKPQLECIKRHFRECPEFIDRPEVQVLEFGPYHIKDIIYFSSIDQMCSCASGLVCIQELIKVKKTLTSEVPNSPWLNLPNYNLVCENDTARYIGCVRQNLRQCQSPLTKRYGKDFTNNDAENVKLMYDFTKEHCDVIRKDDFSQKYKCIQDKTNSVDFKECIRAADKQPRSSKICRIRDCVKEFIEDGCDSDELIPLYIDAVNIYRRDTVRLLNKQCIGSSASDIGISIATVIIAFFIVVVV